jgi:hypothetical protein
VEEQSEIGQEYQGSILKLELINPDVLVFEIKGPLLTSGIAPVIKETLITLIYDHTLVVMTDRLYVKYQIPDKRRRSFLFS